MFVTEVRSLTTNSEGCCFSLTFDYIPLVCYCTGVNIKIVIGNNIDGAYYIYASTYQNVNYNSTVTYKFYGVKL